MTPADAFYLYAKPRYYTKGPGTENIFKFQLNVIGSSGVSDAYFYLSLHDALHASLAATAPGKSASIPVQLSHENNLVWEEKISPRTLAYLCTKLKNEHQYEDIELNIMCRMKNFMCLDKKE